MKKLILLAMVVVSVLFTGCETTRSITIVDFPGYYHYRDRGQNEILEVTDGYNGPLVMSSTVTTWDDSITTQSNYREPYYAPVYTVNPQYPSFGAGGGQGGVYRGGGQIYSGRSGGGGIYRR